MVALQIFGTTYTYRLLSRSYTAARAALRRFAAASRTISSGARRIDRTLARRFPFRPQPRGLRPPPQSFVAWRHRQRALMMADKLTRALASKPISRHASNANDSRLWNAGVAGAFRRYRFPSTIGRDARRTYRSRSPVSPWRAVQYGLKEHHRVSAGRQTQRFRSRSQPLIKRFRNVKVQLTIANDRTASHHHAGIRRPPQFEAGASREIARATFCAKPTRRGITR